ncbi:MAG TPA: AAA family ATPase [Candidatus Binatia bacterium]|jgi:hypothetical protein|nr:AAA family ATPase [Candidatus Binatia bacterium]
MEQTIDGAAFPLINRESELTALRAALADALAGSGRMVLLGGEPGIGKTRLASVIAGEAESAGVPVWWGRGWEDGSAPAFWPWNTALRRWIAQVGPEAAVAAAGERAAELTNVFPALRDHLALPPSERSDADGARFQLFDTVSRFLATVARPSGLVVVLDDVHWADQPSLKLLEFVAADLTDTRLLVVATYRDTEVEGAHPFCTTSSRLAREASARRLFVGGLTSEHCARWVALAGVRGDAAAIGAALHRETNGNPFFLGEIVQLLAGTDEVAPGGDAHRVPQGVREVIARRLDRLGADCRTTLAVAAVAGDTIDAGMLADIVGDASVADHLDRAVRDRILIAEVSRPGELGFAHALIRRVLIDDISPSTRAAWHARIATTLERQATVSEMVTTELVRHLAAAGTTDALHKAFDYACRGAAQAARGLGWEEAVRLYEIALDVGRRADLLDVAGTIELRLALARAWRGAGDVPAARTCCDEVLAACRRTPNPAAAARAALIYSGMMPEWGRIEPAVRAVLEEACRHGAALDDALRARLYSRLAGDLVAANEVEQGARIFALCDEAAASARRAGDAGALAVALTGTYYAAAMLRTSGEMVPSTQEILDAAEAGGEHEYAAAIRYARAVTLLAIGEPEAFSSEVDGLATSAAASHVAEGRWLAQALAALRATVQGRFDEARDAIDQAHATGRRAQLPNAAGVHMSQRIMWHALQGRLTPILPEIETFVSDHPGGVGWRPFRALARLESGDVVAARAELDDLMAAGLGPAERGVMARCYLAGIAALCTALRVREHAPAIYERIARRADAWSVDGCHTLGPWALVLGALARLCNRPKDADRHLEDAIRLGRRMGSSPIVARAQSRLASLRLSMNPTPDERAGIAALLAEAAQTARELGLIDVRARVERLQAKGLRPTSDAGSNAFLHDVDIWSVRYAGRDIRLKDGKGPRYLATLLSAPGREVHVLQFGAASAARSSARDDGLSVGLPSGSLDDAPDQQARREYRDRIADLRTELDEAEQHADLGRSERLRAELDELVTQLAGCFGTRARLRGPAETARKAVTKVLRTQIGKLLDTHPALGRHLRDTVRMGTVCVYAPPTPVAWDVCIGSLSR